jgi:two-component system cell cycle response regulator
MSARVLVIDDDPVNLDLMIYLLNAFGHTPLPAASAGRAMEIMHDKPVDLVLCDIQMPEVDGFEFLRRLNEEKRHSVPVVGLTALAMVGDREKVLAAGFDGYMAKPIEPETFIDDMERFLSPSFQRGRAEARPASNSHDPGFSPALIALERKNVRIVIADNIAANRDVLRILLDYAGYDVSTASSGNEAVALARLERPQVIISDIHMPDGDGFDVLREVKSDPELHNIAVILVSASTQRHSDIDRGIALGATHFLIRPVDPEVLLESIDESISRAGAQQ